MAAKMNSSQVAIKQQIPQSSEYDVISAVPSTPQGPVVASATSNKQPSANQTRRKSVTRAGIRQSVVVLDKQPCSIATISPNPRTPPQPLPSSSSGAVKLVSYITGARVNKYLLVVIFALLIILIGAAVVAPRDIWSSHKLDSCVEFAEFLIDFIGREEINPFVSDDIPGVLHVEKFVPNNLRVFYISSTFTTNATLLCMVLFEPLKGEMVFKSEKYNEDEKASLTLIIQAAKATFEVGRLLDGKLCLVSMVAGSHSPISVVNIDGIKPELRTEFEEKVVTNQNIIPLMVNVLREQITAVLFRMTESSFESSDCYQKLRKIKNV